MFYVTRSHISTALLPCLPNRSRAIIIPGQDAATHRQEKLWGPTLGCNLTPSPPVKLIPSHITTWPCAHSQQGLQDIKPAKTCSVLDTPTLVYASTGNIFYQSQK
jgi:hypothetical protein